MTSFLRFLFFFLFSISLASAQTKTTVSGKLSDTEKAPLAFVNLILKRLPDSSLVKMTVSGMDGSFEFLGIGPGQYCIEGSMVGYRKFRSPDFSLEGQEKYEAGSFTMAPTDVKLKEVDIKANRSMIVVEPDKLVLRVDNNPLMINTNALEILRKSPGVMVNQDDQIFLQGKSGLLIYIDGRQSPLSEKDLANWLRSMPSSQIESIEIITNPSARYDAAGNAGIINIRLKKNQKKGLNGTYSSGVSHGLANEHNYARTNHALILNYGKKNINIYGNYGYDYAKSWSFMDLYRIQSERVFDQTTNNFDKSQTQNYKIGADWKVNKRHTLSIMADGNLNLRNSDGISMNYISVLGNSKPFSLLDAQNLAHRNTNTQNLNFNHQYKDTSGLEITTDVNYDIYTLGNSTNQPNLFRYYRPDTALVDRTFGLNTPVDIGMYTQKTDVEKKTKRFVFGAGYKISNVLTKNTFEYFLKADGQNVKDETQSSRFSYLERVTAGYASVRFVMNEKLAFMGGLRVEHTYSKGRLSSEARPDSTVPRNYINPFFSGGISYNHNKNNSFSLNYSRRIDRPVYRFLNPFEYKIDELSYEQGNPFLRPQYTHNFSLSHTYMSFISSSLSFSNTTQFFARVIDSSGSKTFLTRRNLATVNTFALNISAPLPIQKWWNGFFNLTFNHQVYEANFGPGRKLSLTVDFVNVYMQHSISLPHDITFQCSGNYSSPSVWGGTFRNRRFWFVETGFTKKVLGKKGVISLTCTDIFLSQRWVGRSNFAGVDITARGGQDSRQIKAGFTYNFGQNDSKAGRRRTSNTEERQRLRGE